MSKEVGVKEACQVLGIPRSALYRRRKKNQSSAEPKKERKPGSGKFRALSQEERQQVLDILHSEEYIDKSPPQVYASLLDKEIYICSVRTMYRILEEENEVKERRKQRRHKKYKKPELIAVEPNQVYSWDITKLKGPGTWNYYYLYVIMDIYSRYTVGWMIAEEESAVLAKELIEQTCQRQGIEPDQLTIHSDRGSPMKSKTVAQLLSELKISRSLSRPYVSNDNPYSEAQFKMMKYCPQFPERFGSLPDARSFCQEFFHYYNHEHYHSGIAYLNPVTVHYGQAKKVIKERTKVLQKAFSQNPERFHQKPKHPKLPKAVWINPPKQEDDALIAKEKKLSA